MDVLKKNIDKIEKIFEHIRLFSERGVPIVVEGAKDEQSLNRLGIAKNIVTLKGRKLFEIADALCEKKHAVILTDFDKTGTKIAYDLKREFEKRGIAPNLVYWKQLRSYLKSYSKDIESIAKIVEKYK